MAAPRRFLGGWLALAVFAVLSGLWLWHRDVDRRISTDVLDLIPPAERSPEMSLVRELASQAEAKVMLFVLAGPPGHDVPVDAGIRFAAALKAEPAFAEALALEDPANQDLLGKAVFDRRFTLLFPAWLATNRAAVGAGDGPDRALAERAARHLSDFLQTPQAVPFQDLVPQDPLLLIPTLIDSPGLSGNFFGTEAAGHVVRVWARIAASPLTPEGQEPVFAAIARAQAKLEQAYPGSTVTYTGVNRFAAASKARIQRELSLLNLLSLAAVVAVGAFFLKGAHRALHLIPPVALAVLGAWVAVASAFERIHVLVFVIGSLLTGVAVDYGFYIFLQPPASPAETYGEKIRRIREPLLASCVTTVLGFALLIFSDLPLIRQLGVFVGAGLITALGAALLYFSGVKNPYLPTRPNALVARPPHRVLRLILIGAWALAVLGIVRVHWNDDIRQLQIPTPVVESVDAAVRAQFGDGDDRTVWLTQGPTLAEARKSLDRFSQWLSLQPGAATPLNLGVLVPTEAQWRDAVTFVRSHPGVPAALRDALVREGFDADALIPFFQAYDRYATTVTPGGWDHAVRDLSASLGGPSGLLIHTSATTSWFVTLSGGNPGVPPKELHSIPVDQLRSLNSAFSRYRRSALLLSSIGLGILGLGVMVTYGWREGPRIFAIPCGACLAVFGLWGWSGEPLNLFHLLGAFLGVCMTHNYSIFSANSARHSQPAPMSVRLSALCAAASFGVLGLSAIPAVKALGLTVAAMAVAALIAIECEHFKRRQP